MRELNIAYGNNRQAKRWVNKTIRFDDLKERLRVPIRTTESAEEYAKMSRAQRDTAKDHGGFVAGVLKGGRRKVDTVESRSMVALDGDRIDAAFLEGYETLCPYTSALYTTHSSTEENPRVRLVFPLTRDVTPEEFVAVSRYLAQMLGIDYFDECSYQPNQLMYWPSTPTNGSFVYKETDGGWLDPDAILAKHPEWTDPTRLPTSSRESKANTTAQQKVQDPLTKEGVVGLFNRTYYPISKALEAFLSDIYEPTDNENRWHLIESSSMAGVEIKEDTTEPYAFKDVVYQKLIMLCADICKRNGKKKLLWLGDKDKTLSYEPKSDEMVLTVHRWFANKSCPGNWMYARMGDLAEKVTAQLGGGISGNTETEHPEKLTEGYYRVRKTWADSKTQKGAYKILSNAKRCADSNPGYSVFDDNGVNIYSPGGAASAPSEDVPFLVQVSISDLNIRKGPGTDYAKTGKFTGKGVFTIMEVKSGQGSTAGWGRLKSGAGWISLDYTSKIK